MIRQGFILSLFCLGLASISIWALSYVRFVDWMPYDNGTQVLRLFVYQGYVDAYWFDAGDLAWARQHSVPIEQDPYYDRWQTGIHERNPSWALEPNRPWWPFFLESKLGIDVQERRDDGTSEKKHFLNRTRVGFWLWACVVILWSIPTIAIYRGPWRRRRRRLKGSCVACGYNLCGSESDNCPECGAKRIESHQ